MYPIYNPFYRILYCPMMYSGYPETYGGEISRETEEYRNDEGRELEAGKQHEKGEVHKDDFVHGFVPNHNHGSVNYTSVVNGHIHQCLDITSPPTPSEDGSHVHYTEGYVLFEHGHNHHYKAWSGPAIPVDDGMHVHYYDFYTTEDYGHRHRSIGVDMPAPGSK